MRGFTLIEALIALLVLSFGMLAIAGFQLTLTRSSDLAKQRSEATRLAQQQMERLRAYGQADAAVPPAPAVVNYTTNVVAGNDTVTTNAVYARTWAVTPSTNDSERWINVNVAWTDRAGQNQNVQLLSVIAKFDPSSIGTLATGPGGSRVRKPKNRDLNIPYPAVTLSDRTRSAFIPPPGNITYIFDNATGRIVQSCTGLTSATLVEGLDLAASGATCTNADAYLLTGYVRFDTANSPSGAEPSSPSNARHDTLPLQISGPLTLASSNNPTPNLNSLGSPVCYAQRQKIVGTTSTVVPITSLSRSGSDITVIAANTFVTGQTVAINATSDPAFIGAFKVTSASASSFTYTLPPPLPTVTGATRGTAALVQRITIAESDSVAGYTALISRFVSYACVITPVDHDNLASTPKRWWGQVDLVPNTVAADGTVWAIGATNTTYKVCRYSADYNTTGSIANSEHPWWYRGVTGSLDSQNFLVIAGDQSCPTDKPAAPLGSPPSYADFTTANHQPTPELSFQCGSSNCTGQKVVLEPSLNSTDIPMD